MNKEILIPETQNDLTLGQWQEIVALQDLKDADREFYIKKVLHIIYCLDGVRMQDLKNKDIDYLLDSVTKVINKEPVFKNRFSMGGVEYGFIPNLEDITFGELIDIDQNSDPEKYHKLMGVLFRPITKIQAGKRYNIEKYTGTKDMKGMPLGVALGAIGFFLTLGQQLITDTLNSLTEEETQQAAKLLSLGSGGGIPHFTL